MRKSLSKLKISKINQLLSKQKRQADRHIFDQAQDQQQALKNNHRQSRSILQSRLQYQAEPHSFLSDKKINDMKRTKSKLLLKSEVKNRIENIDDLMQIELKQQSKILNKSKKQFKKYEFKSQQLVSNQIKLSRNLAQSKIVNNVKKSAQISKNKNKKLVDVNYDVIKKYFESKMKKINSCTQAAEVYQSINPLYELCGIQLQYPLVKLYKNCIYYGQHSTQKNSIYEGIIIFYDKKRLYYGQFLNDKKYGFGTQIDFITNSIFIGRYHNGQKIDDFQVIRPYQHYKGPISNWLYEGYGELKTKYSIYKGYFSKGERHGQGRQFFPQTGLTIAGTFIHNLFSNDQEQISKSRSKDLRLSKASRRKLNPEQQLSEFNYDFNHALKSPILQKQPLNASSFRIKGRIKRQKIERRRSFSQQDPLYHNK